MKSDLLYDINLLENSETGERNQTIATGPGANLYAYCMLVMLGPSLDQTGARPKDARSPLSHKAPHFLALQVPSTSTMRFLCMLNSDAKSKPKPRNLFCSELFCYTGVNDCQALFITNQRRGSRWTYACSFYNRGASNIRSFCVH